MSETIIAFSNKKLIFAFIGAVIFIVLGIQFALKP